MDQKLDQENVVDAVSGMAFSLEKKENTATATAWMDLESITLKQRKTNTEWYHLNVKS